MEKISVIMPVFNGEKYLKQSILSVLNQTHEDFLLYIVNDGSTDNTKDVIYKFANIDHRIVTIDTEHVGVSTARNLALEKVDTKYVAFIDSDDIWEAEKLNLQLLKIKSGDFALVYSDAFIINELGEKVGGFWETMNSSIPPLEGEIFDILVSHSNFIPLSSVLADTSKIEHYEGFSKDYRYCQDYDLWLKISCNEKIGCISDKLIRYRKHNQSITNTNEALVCFDHINLFNNVLEECKISIDVQNTIKNRINFYEEKLSGLDKDIIHSEVLNFTQDIPGFLYDREVIYLFDSARELPSNSKVLEIGSFFGKSTNALALGIRSGATIECIDPWLLGEQELSYLNSEDLKVGDSILSNFKSNVKKFGPKVVPLVGTTKSLSEHISKNKYDFVFIDGDHSYEGVKFDIETVLPSLNDNGVLCGHDYNDNWQGVMSAVNETICEVAVISGSSIWRKKNKNIKNRVIIARHFSTGGMPAIVSQELRHRKDENIFLYIPNASGFNVNLDQVRELPNVNIIEYSSISPREVLEEILEKGVNIVYQHDTSYLREELQDNGISCVEMVHSSNSNFWDEEYLKSVEPYCYLAVSPSTERSLRKIGRSCPIKQVRTPIDLDRFDSSKYNNLRKKFGFSEDDFIIMNLGIWSPHKNQGGAITIFKQLKDKISNAKLLLVGGLADNFKYYWEDIISNIEDFDIIVVGETEVPEEYYSIADVYIHTSHAEACCNSIREAAAMNVPCVINSIQSNVDIFPDNCFLYADTDNDGVTFVDQIIRLYENRNIGNELGKLSSSWVRENFNVEQYINTIDQLEVASMKKSKTVKNKFDISYNSGGVKLETKIDKDCVLGLRVLNPLEKEYWEDSIIAEHGNNAWIHYFGKNYFVPYYTQVLVNGKVQKDTKLNLNGKIVFIKFDSKALGDTLAWLPAVSSFEKIHGCEIKLFTFWNEFLRKVTNFDLVDEQEFPNAYASYSIGCYGEKGKNKRNWRTINLREVSCDILAVESIQPLVLNVEDTKPIDCDYICISEHATTKAKMWNKEGAWQSLVNNLVNGGYKVVAISKEPSYLSNIVNRTGDIDIYERAVYLKHAKSFIGSSSGLAWLANAVGTHVFMLNTCTQDWHEFQDNVTHISRSDVCRGCWNRLDFELEKSWGWCPSNLDFQCSRYLSEDYVFGMIKNKMEEL